jgi:hypothetical protein
MTFMPACPARATAASLSAPGCIQTCPMPSSAASWTTFSVTAGGVITEIPWTGSGSDRRSGYAATPSTSAALGLIG